MLNDNHLAKSLSEFGIDPSPFLDEKTTPLQRFYDLLTTWNRRHNLTRIESPSDFIEKHVLDSLLLVPLLQTPAVILDIGTGAGFPGIPLALYNPAWRLVLIESLKKKVAFLHMAKTALGLKSVSICDRHITAETLASAVPSLSSTTLPIYCVSRATHSLADLVTLTKPLLISQEATLIAMKGPKGQTEEAPEKIHTCLDTMSLTETIHGPFILPESKSERFLHVIKRQRERD